MNVIETIGNLTYFILLFFVGFTVIFDFLILVIYIKNGKIDQIKLYKMLLIIMCLINALCILISSFSVGKPQSLPCKITGSLKLSLEIGIDAIQVSLLLITYSSLKYQHLKEKHPILFKILIICVCWTLFIITTGSELIYSLKTEPDILRTLFCIKVSLNIKSFFFFSIVLYLILFLTLLILLYKSINNLENESSDKLQQYKEHLKVYFYGFVITFPNFLFFFFSVIIKLLVYIWPEIREWEDTTRGITYVIAFIFLITNEIAPFSIVFIYCYNKELNVSLKQLCCCSKERITVVNPAESMILFSNEEKE